MRRSILIAVVVALIGGAAVLLYNTLTREAEYRRLIAQGEAALAADQTFVAVEAFSGAIVLKPESMLPHLRRGEAYRRRGELAAALRDLRTATRLDPASLKPLDLIGDVNFALERYGAAAESYAAYLQLDDQSAVVYYKLALSRFRQKDTQGAVTALRQAIVLKEKFPEAYYLLGLCHEQMGQLEEAMTSIQRAIDLAPALLPAHEELVHLLLLLKRENEAIEQLERLAALEPSRTDHLIEAGLIYSNLGRVELAVAELNRALERDPTQPRAYQALGRVWLQAAESRHDRAFLSKAIEALDRGVRGPGATSEGLTLYGRALIQQGDTEGAQQAFEQALDTPPVDPVAYRELASLCERRGDAQRGYDALARYLALAPDRAENSEVAEHLGDLAMRLSKTEDASRWYRQALDGFRDNREAVARLARSLLKAGDTAAATEAVNRALATAPTDPELLALKREIPR